MTLAEVLGTPLLIYGIGNPGRQDDGLGVRLVERLEDIGVPAGVTLDSGYQLAPEDALALSSQDVVLFVDATAEPNALAPCALHPVEPASEISFSTHAMSMGSLLALCTRLYGRAPRAYALAIPAYAFEVNQPLSAEAEANLEQALRDLRTALAGLV
jgi:hydrogenase maturation protease